MTNLSISEFDTNFQKMMWVQTAKAVNLCEQVCAVILGDVRHVTVDRRTVTAEQTLDAHLKKYSRGWSPKPLHSMLTLDSYRKNWPGSASLQGFWCRWRFLNIPVASRSFFKARIDSRDLQPLVPLCKR